ncbi:MAG: delta-60 repeat domain-containing protein [Chloroflexota bacterium]
MSMTHVVAVAILVTLFAVTTIPGHAQLPTNTHTSPETERPADDLDPAFGTNGRIISNLTNSTDAADAVVLPDDRILVLGTLFYPEGSTDGEGSDLMLMRFTSDGVPDPTFGENGIATANVAQNDKASKLIIQPDNKIIVMGQNSVGTVELARFNPDGSLDTTFGNGGSTQTWFNAHLFISDYIEIQPDNNILLIGNISDLEPQTARYGFARYEPDGNLDINFGNNGLLIPDASNLVQAVTIQADGKILIGGETARFDSQDPDITVTRYNPDGTKDTEFGDDGIITMLANKTLQHLLFQENNDLLAAMSVLPDGGSIDTDRDIALTKYRADGSVDPDFRSNEESSIGTAKIDQTLTITVSSTGQTILAGTASELNSEFDIFLVRYAPDGSIEGAITTDLGREEFPRQVLVQSDGKFVVVGTTQDVAVRAAGESDFFLLRYLNSPFNQVYLPLTSR